MREGTTVAGKYSIEEILSSGPASKTARARPSSGGEAVIVKTLPLVDSVDWKNVDLFRREIDVLRALDHPGIPRLLDSLEWQDESGTLCLVLVTEFFPGRNLRDVIASGKRYTEAEAISLFLALLDIVEYIQAVRPPVIHRDINPKNIMVRDDGSIALVDFSGVQDAVRLSSSMGQTMVGTPGYTPLEQFTGKATPRSDLYGCAATMLHVLTHRDPQDLPTAGMKIDVASAVEMGPGLRAVISNWIDPDETRRTMTVKQAREKLAGKSLTPNTEPDFLPTYGDVPEISFGEPGQGREARRASAPATLPADSLIKANVSDNLAIFTIPQKANMGIMATLGGFAFFWLAFVAFWTAMTIFMGAWFMTFFSLPFWAVGIFLVKQVLNATARTVTITVTPEAFIFSQKILGSEKTFTFPLADVGKCSPNDSGMKVNGQALEQCMIEAGTKKFSFATGTTKRERSALASMMNSSISRMRT